MYHSLIFFNDFSDGDIVDGINTWDNWHLVPTSRPVINPPGVRTNKIIIPGMSGDLDLSETLTGHPLYENRTGSIEFIVVNDYWDWVTAYSTIMRHLHGKKLKMMLEDDPSYYYEGRFSVNGWKSDKDWSKITIDYDVHPYKMSRHCTTEDWLWDPFNFEDGIAYDAGLEGYSNYSKIHVTDKTVAFIIHGLDDYSAVEIIVEELNCDHITMRMYIDGELVWSNNNENIVEAGTYFTTVIPPGKTATIYAYGGTDTDACITVRYRGGEL